MIEHRRLIGLLHVAVALGSATPEEVDGEHQKLTNELAQFKGRLVAAERRAIAEYEAVYNAVLRTLPKGGARAKTARLELDYWLRDWRDGPLIRFWSAPPRRISVTTTDGKPADVICLDVQTMMMPGQEFSMAFLLIDQRVVDWASCWTYNRTASQRLLLEDVNDDGFVDVAFRVDRGPWGLDERAHRRPGDDKAWLYAYSITAKGLQSIFPNMAKQYRLKVVCDASSKDLDLKVVGVPSAATDYQLFEFTVYATNKSERDMAIWPAEWFDLSIADTLGYFYGPRGDPDRREVLKPGETVSQSRTLYVVGTKDEHTLNFKFTPQGNRRAFP